MKTSVLTLTPAGLALCLALGATATRADSLVSSMGVYVFPGQNQGPEQQSSDDYECFGWAKGQTGYDPMNPPEVTAQAPAQGPSGSRLRGAARGAAAGAVVSEITDNDTSDAMAAGAVVGGMRGGRQERRARQQQTQQAEAAAGQQQSAMADGFKGAYSACMEAKGYSVKY